MSDLNVCLADISTDEFVCEEEQTPLVLIDDVAFEGPFTDGAHIEALPGIFGIVCQSNDELELLYLDESHCLQDCLSSAEHENNMLFYAENCSGMLSAIVHYTPSLTTRERTLIKNRLIAHLSAE